MKQTRLFYPAIGHDVITKDMTCYEEPDVSAMILTWRGWREAREGGGGCAGGCEGEARAMQGWGDWGEGMRYAGCEGGGTP